MIFQRSFVFIMPLFLGVLVSMGSLSGARAEESHDYIIAANDGYGLQECLAEGGECGQVVADAWCEAHGHGAAVSFGPRSAFVGVGATKISTAEEPYVIKCGD